MGDPDLIPAQHLGGDPRELHVRDLGEVELEAGGEGMAEKASAAVLAELVHLARVGGEELDDAFQPLPDLRVDLVEPAADEAPRELEDGEGTHTPGRVRAAARLMGVVHAGRI